MGSEGTCPRKVRRGDSRWPVSGICGRPIHENGICKMHANADAKRMDKEAAYQAKELGNKSLIEEAEKLSSILGVTVQADYNPYRDGYTGAFVLPGDWVRNLAEEWPHL